MSVSFNSARASILVENIIAEAARQLDIPLSCHDLVGDARIFTIRYIQIFFHSVCARYQP